jgi:hypothetical protein
VRDGLDIVTCGSLRAATSGEIGGDPGELDGDAVERSDAGDNAGDSGGGAFGADIGADIGGDDIGGGADEDRLADRPGVNDSIGMSGALVAVAGALDILDALLVIVVDMAVVAGMAVELYLSIGFETGAVQSMVSIYQSSAISNFEI